MFLLYIFSTQYTGKTELVKTEYMKCFCGTLCTVPSYCFVAIYYVYIEKLIENFQNCLKTYPVLFDFAQE